MRLLLVLVMAATAGCVEPYKLEVRQGNVVTAEMVEKLKPGMTRSQVRFVLGTPLITDPFHPERWDYVYVYKKHARAPAETRHLTLIFDGDRLARLEGELAHAAADETPAVRESAAPEAPAQSARATGAEPAPDAAASP